jgi:acetolactate synthase-1/2/3 large subunit
MNVSEYIAAFLATSGVRTIYELSGGMIMHLLDAVHRDGRSQLINVYHEQAAAFAADATGRITGIPGVALATSGPGAVNLLTGIGSCYFDSSPAVFITGQVNRHEQKGTRAIRQLGFQETDVVSMAGPITKAAWRANSADEVPKLLSQAFDIAVSGRPGPVLLDIPMDVFRSGIEVSVTPWSRKQPQSNHDSSISPSTLAKLAEDLSAARRPLILAGGGVRAGNAHQQFLDLVDHLQIPAVHSLLAVDCLSDTHAARTGMIGTYGNRWANLAISRSDLLLVLGSRLDIRQTGADTESFAAGRTIWHVDIEPEEINNRVRGCNSFVAELSDFCSRARTSLTPNHCPQWHEEINALREEWPDIKELAGCDGINPNQMVRMLSAGRDPAAWCVDVGLHQMWAAQSVEISPDTRFMTSGGMGAMGFALPAAIGVAFAAPERPVVVIAGDGGFQLNIQELQTVAHHKLPVKIVVFNNHCHGMTRQFQDTYFEKRHVGTVNGYSAPDFAAVAAAYGIHSIRVSHQDEMEPAVDRFWQSPSEPVLLEVQIETSTNAYPKLAFGLPISEMEPLAKPMEMEST